MSSPSHITEIPITNRAQLVEVLASGEKPASQWRIGTEHEKFGFRLDDLRPPTFDDERGIEALLTGMTRFGWTPVQEHDRTIALLRGDTSITLEPAGQLELAGAPLETIHQTHIEAETHLREVNEIANTLQLGFIGMGFHPKCTRAQMPWMPKGRYAIMRAYMPKVGQLGLDMMTRTCTVQVNLDYASETDMVKKFRVSLALQPIATALFANSPFTEGKPNGYLSYRSHIWTDTDPDRTGMLDFVFEDGFGYERYVDYLLDVPMYFSYRTGIYHDASGQSFRDFLQGRLPALPGILPTLRDWSDHMTTAFPEVRLKKYIEMRGADSGPLPTLCALPAFWVGLLYDNTALDAAWDLIKDLTLQERHALRNGVPRHALALPFRNSTVRTLALQTLDISRAGLRRRAQHNANGQDETIFLNVLDEIAHSGQTPAQRKLQLYESTWNHDINPIFNDYAY
ncbi:glutamate--cysteine ligase [Xylella fastidiosa subsp. fastidiosa]|uniref:Glutamate--cysteine ligase n=5 Tax=Xylella fastidiosa TaxID=2371 RepID=Q87DM7_XYLFT|nr:glutamate--cysteine ligase [Xylella fastidiosa]ADN63660.1 glutamate-cysteine ligase precursor [Xylella fastidiosa subsp. fastidiosa GB514]KAF0572259.1 glutamate--cysteine ligase [Xylella fastidiosa subsp. fastidiosa Mus-1]AAO28526.1 glutamate-cysteine ligase precursor [Xylella fastidiosa Temecula1]ACB92128.1 glutamate--cysteine ligase [Xylella fastidiosa M23]EGO82095.1 Gamma-glutamylcysteine synthetase [Xylella fastidiosa EB92.1]